jgi:hypothetical protein
MAASEGRSLNRSAASITFGRIVMSPTVLRNTSDRPRTQETAVSIADCSVSQHVAAYAKCPVTVVR